MMRFEAQCCGIALTLACGCTTQEATVVTASRQEADQCRMARVRADLSGGEAMLRTAPNRSGDSASPLAINPGDPVILLQGGPIADHDARWAQDFNEAYAWEEKSLAHYKIPIIDPVNCEYLCELLSDQWVHARVYGAEYAYEGWMAAGLLGPEEPCGETVPRICDVEQRTAVMKSDKLFSIDYQTYFVRAGDPVVIVQEVFVDDVTTGFVVRSDVQKVTFKVSADALESFSSECLDSDT